MKTLILSLSLMILSFQNCSEVDLVASEITSPVEIVDAPSCLEQPETLTYLPGIILWMIENGNVKIYTNSNAFIPQYNTIYGGHYNVPYDWYIDDQLVGSSVSSVLVDVTTITVCRLYKLEVVFLYCGEHTEEKIEQEAYLLPCDP